MFTWNMSLWHCICLLNIQCELCSNYKTEASAIINRQLKSELLQLQLLDWHHRAPHQLGNYRQQLERNTGQPKSVRMCRWMCVSLQTCVFDASKLAVIFRRKSLRETFVNLTAVSPFLPPGIDLRRRFQNETSCLWRVYCNTWFYCLPMKESSGWLTETQSPVGRV